MQSVFSVPQQAVQTAILLHHHQGAQTAHWVVLQNYENSRRNQAALLALADRGVGVLSAALIALLGVTTAEHTVLISAAAQRHILERRQLVSQVDADLAANRIEEALKGPRYIVVPQRTPDVYELVAHVATRGRFVLVALKFVSAARSKSHKDEWWVRTALPFGNSKLRAFKASGRLRPLDLTEEQLRKLEAPPAR